MAVGGLEEYRRLIRGTGLQLGYGRIQGQAGAQQGAVRFIQRVDLVHGDIIQVFYFRDAALGINPAQPASERQGSNEAEQHQQHSGTDFQFSSMRELLGLGRDPSRAGKFPARTAPWEADVAPNDCDASAGLQHAQSIVLAVSFGRNSATPFNNKAPVEMPVVLIVH